MRSRQTFFVAALFAGAAVTGSVNAQERPAPPLPPAGDARPPADGNRQQSRDYGNSSIVTRMMAHDTNKDGKLTKDEITDDRLQRLFDRADVNKDGVVTKEELTALAAR